MVDAARLSDELRSANERASASDRSKHDMERQIKELQGRLDEAEGQILRGGKQTIAKLEQRVRIRKHLCIV